MSDAGVPTRRPESVDALADAVRAAAARGERLLIRGRGTRPGPAAPPRRVDAVLALDALVGVVRHSPGDLVVRVRSGTSLADLDALLAEHEQWFPPGAYRGRGSVGGLLASDAEGALALGHGRAREHVLGATCVHADGRAAASRGDVVKNVAGYDVARLLVGSHGTLGAYAELALRCTPRPERSAALRVALPDLPAAFDAAAALRATQLEPVHLNLLADPGRVLLVLGFDGLSARVAGQLDAAHALLAPRAAGDVERLDDTAARDLRALLEDPVASLGRARVPGGRADDTHAVLRLRAPASALAELLDAARAAPGLRAHVDARPALRSAWLGLHADTAAALRERVPALLARLRRRARVLLHDAPAALRATPEQVWGAPPADHALSVKVKRALDPAGVFAAGRFVGGL